MIPTKNACLHCDNWDCTYVVPGETDKHFVVDDEFKIIEAKKYQNSFLTKGDCGYLKRVVKIHFVDRELAVRHREHLLERTIKEAELRLSKLKQCQADIHAGLF